SEHLGARLHQRERGAEQHRLRAGSHDHILRARAHAPQRERLGDGIAQLRHSGGQRVAGESVAQRAHTGFHYVRRRRHVRLAELEAAGHQMVHLEIGEPDMPTPPHVVEAGVRALRAGLTRYALAAGAPELRDAIAQSLALRGVRASAENLIVAPGAKPMLFSAALTLVEPGAEVLTPDPGFPIYESVIRFAGGRPVYYPLDEARAFAPDVAA